MANHVWQQLLEAVATTVTGLTTTGSNVFQSRLTPLQASEIPALRLRIDGDEVTSDTIGFPKRQTRTVKLVIEAVARQSADVDDKLATICKEVQAALNASLSVNQAGGIARGGIDGPSTDIVMSGEGELDVGVAVMNFTATVYTLSNAPDVAI